ncbi:outer membrane beta-barrel family protein [Aquimarina aquimarini]|uniref:outer membrane beta-barrel family protein n=1 Tax=Aquimarina aquimarini TaxID=1191734 RepID=UPI000D54C48A|nr:outer membrane beta-barrel family protein [Aquimarina aquimarini]
MKQTLYFSFLLISYLGYTQSVHTVSGTVFNQNNISIETGEVYLLDKTSTLLKNAVIKDGKFSFDKLQSNQYIIHITALGYIDQYKKITISQNSTFIFNLKTSSVKLDEVTIKTHKSSITMSNGSIKIDVENSIFESLPSTVDILSKLPEIQISPNQESITIIGKGNPLLYIDNQKTTLDQLKSLSVEDIKSIELIHTPSAKYEAEGRSLILITRKHNLTDGYKIQLSEIASVKRKFNNYLAIHSNYTRNKLELRTSFNYNQLGFWEAADSDFKILNPPITTQSQVNAIGLRPQFIIGGGVYYQIDKNDYVSGQVNIRTHTDRIPINSNTIYKQERTENHITTIGLHREKRNHINSNININKKITKTSSLFFGLQYSNYIRHQPKSQIFNNTNESGFEFSQNRNQKYEIEVFSGRIDIEKEIGANSKIDIGGTFSEANAYAYSNFEFPNPTKNSLSEYDYQESMYGSYAQLSGHIHTFKYITGVRSEATIVTGSFRNDTYPVIDRKQLRIFPKIQFNIPIDSTKNISLNYNTAINRPGYLNASSISTYINPHSEFSRNINLKPSIIEELSATFQSKKYTCAFNYYHKKNPIFYDVTYDTVNNRVISSPQNFEEESGYQMKISNTATYKFWHTTNSLSLIYNKIKTPNTSIHDSKPYLYYYSNNDFKLIPKTTLSLNFWGLTRQHQGVFEKNPFFILNLSFSKVFFNTLKISVNANDIFRNMDYKNKYTSNQITVQDSFYIDKKEIAFTIKYSFDKGKKSSFKNKDIDDNLNRI